MSFRSLQNKILKHALNQTQSFIAGFIASGGLKTVAETVGKATVTEAVKDLYKKVKDTLLGENPQPVNAISSYEKLPDDEDFQNQFNSFLEQSLQNENILEKLSKLFAEQSKSEEIQNISKIGENNKRIKVIQLTDGDSKSKSEIGKDNEDIFVYQASTKKN